MKVLKAILKGFDEFAFWTVALLMGAMGVIAFGAVFFRFVLHDPLAWSEESARYMMVWVTFLGAGYAMGKGRHIGVTMFVDHLPEGARRKVTLAGQLLIIVFMAAVAVDYTGILPQARTAANSDSDAKVAALEHTRPHRL